MNVDIAFCLFAARGKGEGEDARGLASDSRPDNSLAFQHAESSRRLYVERERERKGKNNERAPSKREREKRW